MKNIKFYSKLKPILIGTGISLILTGCSGQEVDFPPETVDPITPSSLEKNFDCFSSEVELVDDFISNSQIERALDVVKDTFVTGIDFIFYDEPIGNVTFDELTVESKKITMDNLNSLGVMTDKVIPGWREELSEKYQVSSQFVDDVYLSTVDKIKDYLGDENYHALGEIKNQITHDIDDKKNDVKEYIKSWYEEFRSSK